VNAVDPLVLLVEDEPQMRRFLRTTLPLHSFRLIEAPTVREGLMSAASHQPQIVLLDLGLPDGDGMDFIRRFREWSRTPVIVLSARGRESDKVDALDAGADDYVTKPFGVDELLARIRVALRHAAEAGGGSRDPVLELGSLRIDFAAHDVRQDGNHVHLTPTEFRLLSLLARHAGKLLTHRQILREIWGPGSATQTHTLRVYMAELRRKIEKDPARPQLLTTEPGVGYRLRDPSSL
jgi:two-component system KDP operon response regulator KdpE